MDILKTIGIVIVFLIVMPLSIYSLIGILRSEVSDKLRDMIVGIMFLAAAVVIILFFIVIPIMKIKGL